MIVHFHTPHPTTPECLNLHGRAFSQAKWNVAQGAPSGGGRWGLWYCGFRPFFIRYSVIFILKCGIAVSSHPSACGFLVFWSTELSRNWNVLHGILVSGRFYNHFSKMKMLIIPYVTWCKWFFPVNLQCIFFNVQLKAIFYFLEVIIQPLDYQEAEDGCGWCRNWKMQFQYSDDFLCGIAVSETPNGPSISTYTKY